MSRGGNDGGCVAVLVIFGAFLLALLLPLVTGVHPLVAFGGALFVGAVVWGMVYQKQK